MQSFEESFQDGESMPSPPPRHSESGGRALTIIATILVAAVVTYLGPILKPLLIAIFAFFIVKWAVGALAKLGIPAWLDYALLFAIVTLAIAGFAIYVQTELKIFQRKWDESYRVRIESLIERHAGAIPELGENLKLSSREVFTYALHTGMGLLELLTLVFFYLLFLILGAAKMQRRVKRAFAPERADHILSVMANISSGMEKYMRTKAAVSAGMATTAAVVMGLFGLDHWLLWAAIVFALNYVTYIGSLLAIVPPVLVGILQFSETPVYLFLLVGFLVANRFLWIDYVEIRMLGKSLDIDPVLLFLWLAYWAWAWGVLGLILAFPMVTALKIVLKSMDATRHWTELMSEE